MEKTDVVAIWSNMRYKEKEVWQKRKFLMGLSESDTYDKKGTSHAETCEELQESFLRKDDVFYEELKKFVEKGFGALNADAAQDTIEGDDVEFHNLHHMSRVILNLLDDLSNNGLYCLAKIVTEDSVIHDKTRPVMRRVIKERLAILQSKQCLSDQGKILGQVSKLVRNQENFRQNHVKHSDATLKSHRGAIMKVLDGLRDMPTQTLIAIHRKLKGIRGYMPQLCPPKCGWTRDRLIDRVRMLCLEMMGQLGESDRLQEPLAKAMAVAGLSYKLASGYQDLSLTKFVHVTPQLEALQNEIFKAIQSLGQRTKTKEINRLQQLLDPKSEMGDFRAKAIKNMLIEFLYECSDMDTIPDYLVEALSIINNTSFNRRRFSSKDLIENEVECVLNVGAHIKQILWDHIPDDKLDEDFAHAYMEELEESDDGDIFDDDDDDELELFTDTMHEIQVRLNDFNEEVQSTGDPDHECYSSQEGDLESTNNYSSSSFGAVRLFNDNEDECMNTNASRGKTVTSTSSGINPSLLDSPMSLQCGDVKETQCPTETNRNRYVALQEVTDHASLVAHQLIAHMMDEFGRMGALGLNYDDDLYGRGECSRPEQCQEPTADSMGKDASVVVFLKAVHNVMPSFPSSELEKVEKFLSS